MTNFTPDAEAAIRAEWEDAGEYGQREWALQYAIPLLDALAAARAEVEELREAAHIGIELDNHHNAAMCPYCRPLLATTPSERTPADDTDGETGAGDTFAEARREALAFGFDWDDTDGRVEGP